MHTLLKLMVVGSGLLLLVASILHFGVLPYYDRKFNSVLDPGPYVVSANTRTFHNSMFVADLHADALLWNRNLKKRNSRGQVDLPRLRDGGVDLQVFGVVTKVPDPINYDANTGDTDSLPLLFIAALRPPNTWFSPMERALIQAEELRKLTDQSLLLMVLNRRDLDKQGVKGLLALEGMHGLDGGEEALLTLYSAGFRMMGLAHFFDNDIAGSSYGLKKKGLTELGSSLIPRLEELGITIDLAHASPAAFEETLDRARKPVVVSHGGVKGTCQNQRNLSDSQLKRISENGGVVGIGYWKTAVCGVGIKPITEAIVYAIQIAGINHVGLGSDFDGKVVMPFDSSGLPMLTAALLSAGLSQDDVRKVMGGNVRRVLLANLPENS